jgi:Spy/CpxP family protein refolding chaperone
MQRVFHTLAIVSLVAILAAPLAAQEKQKKAQQKGGKRDATAQTLAFLDKVELTAEQKTKIDDLKAQHGPKIAEAQKNVNAILTPEAKKQVAAARKQAQADGKKGKDLQAAVQAALKLSPEDAAKHEKAQADLRQANQALRNAVIAVLTPEQVEAAGVKGGKKAATAKAPGAEPKKKKKDAA